MVRSNMQKETIIAATIYNPSILMSAFNFAKTWARSSGLSTIDRVDRAFGYLQSGQASTKWDEYETTLESCGCRDREIRHLFCKHILSQMIHVKHEQLRDECING